MGGEVIRAFEVQRLTGVVGGEVTVAKRGSRADSPTTDCRPGRSATTSEGETVWRAVVAEYSRGY